MKSRRDYWLFGAFMAFILAGMVVGVFGDGRLMKKDLSDIAFGAIWIIAINIWIVAVLFQGDLRLGQAGGISLASRSKSPIRFWSVMLVLFALFNGLGFVFLVSSGK